jgi:hypothetical protein
VRNQEPRPFVWKTGPDKIVAAVKRGHQTLETIHQMGRNPFLAIDVDLTREKN